MELTTDKEKLIPMIDESSIRGRALMLLLINGPLTASEISKALEVNNKKLTSNLNSIKQEASHIELKISKSDLGRNVYEFIGLYKPMRALRSAGYKKEQPIGMLEQSYQSVFSLMNKLQTGNQQHGQ